MSITSPHGTAWVWLDIASAVQQTGSVEILNSMLPMLQELLERDLPLVEQFLAQDDVRSANPLLHSLKGCLPIFCVPALCEELARVEILSKAGGAVEVTAAYVQLRPKLRQLEAEVAQYLALPTGDPA